jgi:hypothetical protein
MRSVAARPTAKTAARIVVAGVGEFAMLVGRSFSCL